MIEDILDEVAGLREPVKTPMQDLQAAIRRGKKHARRANFRAARREAIEWRARIRRGERLPPPGPPEQPRYKQGAPR